MSLSPIAPKPIPKQVTHWYSKTAMMPSQYGHVSHLVWCQLDAQRMNEKSMLTNYVAEKAGYCCITRSRPSVLEEHGCKVV